GVLHGHVGQAGAPGQQGGTVLGAVLVDQDLLRGSGRRRRRGGSRRWGSGGGGRSGRGRRGGRRRHRDRRRHRWPDRPAAKAIPVEGRTIRGGKRDGHVLAVGRWVAQPESPGERNQQTGADGQPKPPKRQPHDSYDAIDPLVLALVGSPHSASLEGEGEWG